MGQIKITTNTYNNITPNIIEVNTKAWAKVDNTLSKQTIRKSVSKLKKDFMNIIHNTSSEHINKDKSYLYFSFNPNTKNKGKTYLKASLFFYKNNDNFLVDNIQNNVKEILLNQEYIDFIV